MLEIGSHEGRSAIWWCQNLLLHPQSRLVCIDIWEDPVVFKRFVSNMTLMGLGLKAQAVKVRSADAKIQPGTFHLCYLDGSHKAHDVYSDLLVCWKALVHGGLLILDDYGWTNPGVIGPKPAIDGFLASFKGQYRTLHSGYQIILKKL